MRDLLNRRKQRVVLNESFSAWKNINAEVLKVTHLLLYCFLFTLIIWQKACYLRQSFLQMITLCFLLHMTFKLLQIILAVWKFSKYGVFSGPYFPAFSSNTRKYESEKTPYLDTFHAVFNKELKGISKWAGQWKMNFTPDTTK